VAQYDPAKRRQAARKGRERGAWVYVPASELEAAGVEPSEVPPYYRLWTTKGGKRKVLIQFYVEG